MSGKPVDFALPRGMTAARVRSLLKGALRLSDGPREDVTRTYYDSFDWRLQTQGSELVVETARRENKLTWRSRDSGTALGGITVSDAPRFAWELPTGPLRRRLEPVLEMRALLPQVALRSRIQTLNLLNKDRKTTVRVVIETNKVVDPSNGKTITLGEQVTVFPVRGYPKPFNDVCRLLTKELGLEQIHDDQLTRALSLLGREPGDYSSKLDFQLDPAMRADAAAKTVLLHLLGTMERNEAGTKADLDSEFLHEFRVAVRRSRSALSQIKGVFPSRALARYTREFAWLGSVTGPTRDMDVYLLNFEDYQASLSPSIRDHILPLRNFLRAHQKMEQQTLAKMLESARYRKLVKDWRAFLEAPVPPRSGLPNAKNSILTVATNRIWRVYRRVMKDGRSIKPDTPAEALHELRKTCKKLRYLMEFFQSLYPASRVKQLITVLKRLQENLGDFQDFEVQVATLERFSEQMMEEGAVPPETLIAIGILIEGLEARQHRARKAFASRFTQFSAPKHRRLFKEVFDLRRSHEDLAA